MIHSATLKQLQIILPNTNKALAKVLENLSSKDFQTLSKGKDLGSVMQTLLKESAAEPKQNKLLLDLVKSNPTLSKLGNVTTLLKELTQTLKTTQETLKTAPSQVKTEDGAKESSKAQTTTKQLQHNTTPQKELSTTLQKLQDVTQKFQTNIKEIQPNNLQIKLQNSGVFLESKIKNFTPPLQDLKTTLTQLSTQLQNSKIPMAKQIDIQITQLLKSDIFTKNTPAPTTKTLAQLTTQLTKLLMQLEKTLQAPVEKSMHPHDTLFTKETQKTLTHLHKLNKPQQLQPQQKTQEFFTQDLKAQLLKAHEEIDKSQLPQKQELLKHIDKLTLQIDYHQLLSHLSSGSSLYIPYTWEELEDGNIFLQKTKNGKFFCDIELELKEYGSLKLRLGMFEKNHIDINITAQNQEFKELLQENIAELKKQLTSVGIIPQSIRFLDENKDICSAYAPNADRLEMGFEVKA